jgi:hypothetical protein
MVDLGEAMLDAMVAAAHGEHVGHVSGRGPIGDLCEMCLIA